MLLDDTDTTTYIHDLGHEVAQAENEEFWVSLSPVADKLMRVPKAVLGSGPKPQGNELVLYQEPTSLTVPIQQDNVRKAIVEYRERARASQRGKSISDALGHAQSMGTGSQGENVSEDAMDVD